MQPYWTGHEKSKLPALPDPLPLAKYSKAQVQQMVQARRLAREQEKAAEDRGATVGTSGRRGDSGKTGVTSGGSGSRSHRGGGGKASPNSTLRHGRGESGDDDDDDDERKAGAGAGTESAGATPAAKWRKPGHVPGGGSGPANGPGGTCIIPGYMGGPTSFSTARV